MANSLETIAAKLRSGEFKDANDLAQYLATMLAGETRLPSFRRGLASGVVASRDGGTTLDVGDPSASRRSISMQPPQRGLPVASGALRTRMQARCEQETKSLPALVISAEEFTEDEANWIRIVCRPKANDPKLVVDTVTNQNIASGKPFDLTGTEPTVTIEQRLLEDDAVPVAGETIQVTNAKQYDTRCIWTDKEGRKAPVVNRTLEADKWEAVLKKKRSTTTTSGCLPKLVASIRQILARTTDGWDLAAFQGAGVIGPTEKVGRFWRIIGHWAYSGNPFYETGLDANLGPMMTNQKTLAWGHIDATGKLRDLPRRVIQIAGAIPADVRLYLMTGCPVPKSHPPGLPEDTGIVEWWGAGEFGFNFLSYYNDGPPVPAFDPFAPPSTDIIETGAAHFLRYTP